MAKANQLANAHSIDGVNFNGTADITHFGTCSTAANTAAKVVSVANFKLVSGSIAIVKFTVTNTANNPTLNVNNTGAKNIRRNGLAISPATLGANTVYQFVYDGTNYNIVGDPLCDIQFTDWNLGDSFNSRQDQNGLLIDAIVPVVGVSTNPVYTDINGIDSSYTYEINWTSVSGYTQTYPCTLNLGDRKKVIICTATDQVTVDLSIINGKHYGYIANGTNGAFGLALLRFDGTNLRVLKMSGVDDQAMNDLTLSSNTDIHDMFKFLPVGTEFISSDGLTKYTKKSDTEVLKEVFVL